MMQHLQIWKFSLSVFAAACLMLIPNASEAQFFFGPKAGLVNTTIQGDVFNSNNYKMGASAGITFGVTFGDFFTVQPEILYTQKGFQQNYTEIQSVIWTNPDSLIETTSKYNNKLELNYAEVPLLFKFSFSLGNGIKPYDPKRGPFDIDVFFGPYVGYLLSAKQKSSTNIIVQGSNPNDEDGPKTAVENEVQGGKFGIGGYDGDFYFIDTIPGYNPTSYSLSNGLNKIDYGVVGGIGISLEIGKGKLCLDARYTQGFASIDDKFFNEIDYTIQDENWDDLAEQLYLYRTERSELAKQGISTKIDQLIDQSRKKSYLINQSYAVYLSYILYLGKD